MDVDPVCCRCDWLRGLLHSGSVEARRTQASDPAATVASMPLFACFDVETTRLDPQSGHIIEIAVVRVERDGTPAGEWTTLINAGTMDVGRSDIHGIDGEWLPGAPTFLEIAGDLAAELTGCIPVAHNASFDIGFIEAEWSRAGLGSLDMSALDTLPMARSLDLPGRLSDLSAALGVTLDDAHQALGDARALSRVLLALLDRGASQGPVPAFGLPQLSPPPSRRYQCRPRNS